MTGAGARNRTAGTRAAARLLVVAATVGAAASAFPATLTRAPYLQLLTTESVMIAWQTDVPAACAVALAPLGGPATLVAGGTGTACAVPVAGLVPGRQYGYIPLADGEPVGPDAVFQVDDPALPFVFLAVGDTGDGGAAQRLVRDRMVESPRDLIVHTGDMIYPSAETHEWDPKFFAPYAALVRELVFWPCLGNHDVEEDGGTSWREAFFTPANNDAFSEDYYSFDFGNAHFVVLDSNASVAPGSAQHGFLEADPRPRSPPPPRRRRRCLARAADSASPPLAGG